MITPTPTNWTILLTYRIRDGADADGYDDWLRTIDNPFFNAIPDAARFANFGATYTDVPWAATAMDNDAALSTTLIAAPDGFVESAP